MPITRREYAAVPFVRPAYEPDTRTLRELMLMAGNARSQAEARKGQARADGLMTLGQLIGGGLAGMRQSREREQAAMAAAQRQEREDALKLRDQQLREADLMARMAEREQANQRQAQLDAQKFGDARAKAIGYGPVSEMDVDPLMQSPERAGDVRYAFGPGTANGPELMPTPEQQRGIQTQRDIEAMGGKIGPNGQVVRPETVNLRVEDVLLDGRPTKVVFNPSTGQFRFNGQDVSARVQPVPPQRTPPAPSYQWAKDPKTGDVRLMSVEEIRTQGAQQPDTADMRNKQAGKRVAAKAVDAVRALGTDIFKRVGPAQRAEAIKRGVEAVFGTDPNFLTYQDSRMALAGTLAVEQQGGRVSDADVKALWLPMVPDAYRDTKESYELKWKLIDAMRGVEEAAVPKSVSDLLKDQPDDEYELSDGSVWIKSGNTITKKR